MIRNQWYAILESNEVKSNKLCGVKRLGEKIIFWRDHTNTLHCIADQCCHRGASLSCGHLVGDYVQCPFHGFEFNGEGQVTSIPAQGKKSPVGNQYKVKSYLVKEAHGFIWLWWGDPVLATYPIPFFESLTDNFSYSTLKDLWPTHYSRCIENQLDCVHVPFVHRTTIGRGNKTVVNGPKVIQNDALLTFYVHNVIDTGNTSAESTETLNDYTPFAKLEFLFPNLWHNVINDKVRVFAAFAPIDEEHTLIYLRFYQKFITLPLITPLINQMGKLFSKIVLQQDKRVVITQLPLKSELFMNEKLIPGDAPIITYRTYRQSLKENNPY